MAKASSILTVGKARQDARYVNVSGDTMTGTLTLNGDTFATQGWVTSTLIDSAPGTLDTLNELAAALGDDPNFATTVTNNLAAKLSLSGGTMTGNLVLKSISGTDGMVENTHGGYLHLGGWGVGRTDATAILVNTAYRADILSTTRNIALSGDVTGNANFNGGADITITATVADNSHNHNEIKTVSTQTSGYDFNDLYANNTLRFHSTYATTGNWTGSTVTNYPTSPTATAYPYGITISAKNTSQGSLQIYAPHNQNNQSDIFFRTGWSADYKAWARIWTDRNDGSGSGLDADLLDGQHASAFQPAGSYLTTTGKAADSDKLDGINSTGFVRYDGRLSANADTVTYTSVKVWDVSTATDAPSGAADGLLTTKYWDSSNWAVQNYHDFHTNKLFIRSKQSGTWQTSWAEVWSTDNFNPATKLDTSHDMTLTLSGDATGSATFTNMGNATLNVTVADNSHTHYKLDNSSGSGYTLQYNYTNELNAYNASSISTPLYINYRGGNVILGPNQVVFDAANARLGIGTAAPSYRLQADGDIYANGGWFRVSGNQGLYFQSHGGGWYMSDSSWIRNYGSKSVLLNNTLRLDGNSSVLNSYKTDTGVILQSYNTSASNAAQFFISHNNGSVNIGNSRGDIAISAGNFYVGGGYIQAYGTNSMNLRRVNSITFAPDNSWNDATVHGIMSTNDGGGAADSISINSYNDITLRLDANNNNAASYMRIMNNTAASSTIAYIGYDGGTNVAYFGGVATAANDFRAPIFYDSADTNYYLDPNSTSNLYAITMPHLGSGTANIKVNNGGSENWRAIHIGGGSEEMGIGKSNTNRSVFSRNSMAFHVNASESIRLHSSSWTTLFEVAGGTGDAWLKGNLGINEVNTSARLHVTGDTAGSDVLAVDGVNGRLFTVTDDLTDSLFSVNTIAGLPVIEAFADQSIKLGPFTAPVEVTSTGELKVDGGTDLGTAITGATVSNDTITFTRANGGTFAVTTSDANTDTNYYLSGADFNINDGVLTLTVTGGTDQTVDLDGRYLTEALADARFAALAGNTDVSFEVNELTAQGIITATGFVGDGSGLTGLPAVPTNNNQLTNGAGYIALNAGTANWSIDSTSTYLNQIADMSGATGTFNTALGYGALRLNTTGRSNTVVGANAAYNVTTAENNTVVGKSAAYDLTTGTYNTHIGTSAGSNATTGTLNTYLGYSTGNQVTTTNSNTFVGARSGLQTTTADYSTMIGVDAGWYGGAESTFVGAGAGLNSRGIYNIAIGRSSLYGTSGTTGNQNIGIGTQALQRFTSGGYNIAIGNTTLEDLTTGGSNVAVGSDSSENLTTGNFNTSIGTKSFQFLIDGSENTATGLFAGQYHRHGNSNTAVGQRALWGAGAGTSDSVNYNTALGAGALASARTSTETIGIGRDAGNNYNGGLLLNSTECIFIGSFTKSSNDNAVNQIVIGDSAVGLADNTVVIGNAQINENQFYGVVLAQDFIPNSDSRLKENVSDITYGIETVKALHPVSYNFIGKEEEKIGLIAQEVEQVVPEVVFDSENGYKGLNYNALVPVLIKSIQELEARVASLEQQLNT